MKISAVVNTFNEEKNIARCLASLTWADEIIVWDASSTDKTVEIAKQYTPAVHVHNDTSGFVEPQRNAAIEKASGDWILVLDADEEIPATLVQKLRELSENATLDYLEIPRKNIIFSKWIEHTGWWPDYQLRFFRKGKVTWKNEIHSKPETSGTGVKLDIDETLAIIHHNYDTIEQFITKLNTYTSVQAQELVATRQQFQWEDLVRKPHEEFLQRFFANQGYEDKIHGLLLSYLQAFSFLVVQAKIWESGHFDEPHNIDLLDKYKVEFEAIKKDMNYWFRKTNGKKSVASKIKKVLGR